MRYKGSIFTVIQPHNMASNSAYRTSSVLQRLDIVVCFRRGTKLEQTLKALKIIWIKRYFYRLHLTKTFQYWYMFIHHTSKVWGHLTRFFHPKTFWFEGIRLNVWDYIGGENIIGDAYSFLRLQNFLQYFKMFLKWMNDLPLVKKVRVRP